MISLEDLTEEQLLKCRLCDLPVSIDDTWLKECVDQLYLELEMKGLVFRPECYLADEWLVPDKHTVIGIAFYLAHPALTVLERKMMFEAEGEGKDWCMKLLRHEAGHAINYAYNLYRKKKWRDMFGCFNREYEDTYRFRPYSKNFVRHLEDHYAQAHPDEDFAETFAVWLDPDSDWKFRYRGWGALKKIKYMNDLMCEIKEKAPANISKYKFWHIAKEKRTLKTYYKQKRHLWAEDFPDFHDENLKKIFVPQGKQRAAVFIKKQRHYLRDTVASWTGEKKYLIDDLLGKFVDRCNFLELYSAADESRSIAVITSYLTACAMNHMYTGSLRGDKR